MDIVIGIGRKIRNIRNRKNMSLEDLAYCSGIDASPLSKLERGESNPTIRTLCNVAKGLNVPLLDILDFDMDFTENQMDDHLVELFICHLKKLTAEEQNDVFNIMKTLIKWKNNYQDHHNPIS